MREFLYLIENLMKRHIICLFFDQRIQTNIIEGFIKFFRPKYSCCAFRVIFESVLPTPERTHDVLIIIITETTRSVGLLFQLILILSNYSKL